MTYYGQWETDRVIETYFPDKKFGFCIEVGAYDGVKNSNTLFFEKYRQWFSVCIEPNPSIFPALVKNRSGYCFNFACGKENTEADLHVVTMDCGKQCALTSLELDQRLIDSHNAHIKEQNVQSVQVRTLDSILESVQNTDLDFISIDTEGTEYDVILGFDLTKWKPHLLVIEDNYDERKELNHLETHGYTFDQRYKVNNFYVRK